jgi:predicted dithiol-disulfide oxidoreductase (DUF899 family)
MSTAPTIATPDQWLAQRKALLARERSLTHLRDEIAAERRKLPWVRVQKDYVFDAPEGKKRLADLFGGRGQLVVQHFMLGPGWKEGCKHCSYMADHTDPMTPHLAQRDIAFVAISRAPLADIERFKRRMGWKFDWVSSNASDFNFDYCVSFRPEQQARDEVTYNFAKQPWMKDELPGISVFVKDASGAVFHTYSTYSRGAEAMMGTYSLIDLTPKGRDEEPGRGMAWVKHHDRYETTAPAEKAACCDAD